MRIKSCNHCHQCGTKLMIVLDGEEWCSTCGKYRRYRSHGWSTAFDQSACKFEQDADPTLSPAAEGEA